MSLSVVIDPGHGFVPYSSTGPNAATDPARRGAEIIYPRLGSPERIARAGAPRH